MFATKDPVETAVEGRETRPAAALRIARTLGTSILGGAIAGAIAGGAGSRLAMRIAGASEPACRGLVTENGNACGAFTVEGTVFLVLFGAMFFGAPAGLLYLGVRSWLAPLRAWRGLAYGGLLLAATGFMVLDPHNVDFHRFGSPTANVITFGALYLAYGAMCGPLIDAIDRRLPTAPTLRPFRVSPTLGYAIGAVPALGVVLAVVGTAGVSLLGLGILAVVSALPRVLSAERRAVRIAVYALLALPVLAGVWKTTGNVAAILSGPPV